jgi:outer membrane receptor protein involved in Fe transport
MRLGFHHNLSPGSDLIGNFMYGDLDADLHDNVILDPVIDFNLIFDNPINQDAYSGELQHLFSSKHVNIVTGIGYFEIDSKDEQETGLTIFDPPVPLQSTHMSKDEEIRHINLYLYSYINLLKNLTFTIGGSADFLDDDAQVSMTVDNMPIFSDVRLNKDRDQFNPKLGVTWNPVPDTTLRAAVFRVLKRTLITNQTLEPTQVAGFNQFFDDFNATESWRYGIAIDQKFSKSIYGGAEYSYRDLKEVPFTDATEIVPEVKDVEWNEYLGRAYLYWAAHKWFALSAEYLYERFERERLPSGLGAFGLKDAKTHRVPLGINFCHPSGLRAMLKATYTDQEGNFERETNVGTFIPGEDRFWLFDAAISYRLPKRYGFITVGAQNLFDKEFKYHDTNPFNPIIQPDRFIYGKVTLVFP